MTFSIENSHFETIFFLNPFCRVSFAAKYSAQNKRHGFFNIFWALYLFKKMHRENDNSTIKISYFFLYSIAAYKMKKNDIKIKKNLNSPNLNLISSKMSTWQKPASQRLAGRPSNQAPWVYPVTGCASQSSDVDVSSLRYINAIAIAKQYHMS